DKAALAGLRVVDLSNLRTGAQVSQLLADFGADVVHVETPGGSALRAEAAWPFWGRGKRSVQLDLKAPADLEVAQALAGGADIVIETFRPGVAERLGLGYDALAKDNPGLIYASISGFGQSGPYAGLQGYEGVVMAKLGVLWAVSGLAGREGPAFPSAAFSSYPASQLALQAILAALYERQTTGVGQAVGTTLAQALSVYDTFNWFSRVMATRYGQGFSQTARAVDGIPTGGLSFRLLIALTKDGQWLQFSQTPDRLFRAMMGMFGLEWMFSDPKWQTAPDFDEPEKRLEFWEILLQIVRTKTAAEWFAEFDRNPDVWGERFRKGSELLDHPQMQYNGSVAAIVDPERGPTRQPGALVRADATPARLGAAPRLGEHDAAIRREAADGAATRAAAVEGPKGKLPLEGVTLVELGTYYAAPYGATLLAELGARVIKLEQPDGDPHRHMLPFPEIAGLKVLQGKECVAVDLHTDKGREIAHRILSTADIVLQSFRAGVAERLGLDARTLRALNPELVYLSAPGYGEGGPCGHRPAFAPTIGAGAGWAWRNAGSIIPEGDLALDQIKPTAIQLGTAVMGVANSDGLSAATCGTAMLLGLVARARGAGGQSMLTSMLASTAHALGEVMTEYPGRPEAPMADPGLHGWNALYRLYAAGDGEWVFLAAPSPREWARFTGALPDGAGLAADPRFATPQARAQNDAALAGELESAFRSRPARDWETLMRAADVACVECARGPVEANYMDEGSLGQLQGYVTQGRHPILDEVPRLKALFQFSRSATCAGDAGLVGQDSEKVLRDYGYSADEVSALAQEGVILVG
ncbi:MAG: CoA transferase, partial [Phenylobacterium sp.]|nr:CoA transferase [Phenylobacterium sp.]